MPESCHVESDSDGMNVVRLGHPTDHIDHEVELVIRLGEGLRPGLDALGVTLPTEPVRAWRRRNPGHGSKESRS